jgi:hypothetical protein
VALPLIFFTKAPVSISTGHAVAHIPSVAHVSYDA